MSTGKLVNGLDKCWGRATVRWLAVPPLSAGWHGGGDAARKNLSKTSTHIQNGTDTSGLGFSDRASQSVALN